MAKRTEKRTQIYLMAEQHEAAMRHARKRGGSLAGVVREALTRYLASAEDDEADWTNDPALALAGSIELPPRPAGEDLNDFIDRIVYDQEPELWSLSTVPDSSQPSTETTPGTPPGGKRGKAS